MVAFYELYTFFNDSISLFLNGRQFIEINSLNCVHYENSYRTNDEFRKRFVRLFASILCVFVCITLVRLIEEHVFPMLFVPKLSHPFLVQRICRGGHLMFQKVLARTFFLENKLNAMNLK